MTASKQCDPSHNPSGEADASQNERSAKEPESRSATATPSRPSNSDSSSSHGRPQGANSSSSFSDAKKPPGKVAIPRQPPGQVPRYNRRVPRACESCRQRKTKCSGDTPICRQCRELRVTCHYPVGWRERMKKEVDRLSAEVNDYEGFLSDLQNASESHASDWIKALLEKHGLKADHLVEDGQSLLTTPQNEMEVDEPSPVSSIGSLEAVGRADEDHNRTEQSRATGFMGKSSEVSWMQRLQKETEQRARDQPGALEPNLDDDEVEDPTKDILSLHALNYHLDDLDISVPGPVQRYKMPPRQLADRLFEEYLTSVHPFFPIISRPLFCAQYETFVENSSRSTATRPGDKWLAILNMIFAIAAKHSHLTNAPWRGDENDHLVYLARARLLSMNGEVLFSHPDLQQVQVEALIAFYLLASDQINRAWRILVLAMRSAITLGINMKNNSSQTPHIAKEARYRVWWCLYSFEHLLGIMTGRAIYTLDGGYATPLPLPYDEEQLQQNPAAIEVLNDPALRDERVNNVMASSWLRQPGGSDDACKDPSREPTWVKSLPANFGLCFLYLCDLTVVTQEIVNRVYSTNCVTLQWSEIESRLDDLRSRIDYWQSSLPAALDFTQKVGNDRPEQLRCKVALAFHYYSARITLGRPCLCRRDTRQSNSPQSLSHMMAVISLESASRMLDMIPDEPNVLQLYQICPWWCVLHYLMQAATVILLELSFGSIHVPEQEEKLVHLSKKVIRWFHAMSERSIGSRRAWQLCDSSFRKLAGSMKYSVDDLPSQEPHQDHTAASSVSRMPPESGQPMHPYLRDYFSLQPEDMNPLSSYSVPHTAPNTNAYASYFNLPTPDLAWSLPPPPDSTDDSYFPYDSLSQEFIRSFFPSSEDESKEKN